MEGEVVAVVVLVEGKELGAEGAVLGEEMEALLAASGGFGIEQALGEGFEPASVPDEEEQGGK